MNSMLRKAVYRFYNHFTPSSKPMLYLRLLLTEPVYVLLRERHAVGKGDPEMLKYFNGKLNELEFLLGRTELRSMPIKLRVGVTRRCNLKCIMCGVAYRTAKETSILEERNLMDLSIEDYNVLAREVFPTLSEIEFNQNGEAFVLGERFMEMLRTADSYGVSITLSTNGMLLEPYIDDLVSLKHLDKVVFSIDGAKASTVEGIRVGSDFNTIVRNLRKMVSKRKDSRPEIEIHFAAMKRNIEELPELVKLAGGWGVDTVSVSYLYLDDPLPLDESLYFHKELASSVFRKARTIAESCGVNLWLPPPFGFVKETKKGYICRLPWNFPSIEPGGLVMPCCMLFSEEHSMGLLSSGFKAVWNGKKYRQLRGSFLRAKPIFEKCRHCNFNPEGFDVDDLKSHLTERKIKELREKGK